MIDDLLLEAQHTYFLGLKDYLMYREELGMSKHLLVRARLTLFKAN